MENILSQTQVNYINEICSKYNITNYTINSDGSIDVDGDVIMSNGKFGQKLPIKFGKVSGKFYCRDNRLTTLEGCPTYVGDTFSCGENELTTLEFAPNYVGGDFICECNYLKSLEYIGEIVGNIYYFGNSLPHKFTSIIGYLTKEEKKVFFKYQSKLDIWSDGEVDEVETQLLVNDIKDGLL